MKNLNVVRLFLLCMVLVFSGQQARAYMKDVNGLNGVCIQNGSQKIPSGSGNSGASIGCTLDSDRYVPTGNYTITLALLNPNNNALITYVETTRARIEGTKKISEQAITSFVAHSQSIGSYPQSILACQFFHNMDSGIMYSVSENSVCLSAGPPLPPTPPETPDTSCTLNDGNALNVNLNNVDRSQMPTVPGSGSMRHIQVPVECTGGDVTVNMQLNYTPISLSAGEVIKSSSNGLGVSVVYDSKILSSTDITPVTFLAGSNSMDLAFQAVRDPTVEIKDVPTGAFTASAVLVMTQQ